MGSPDGLFIDGTQVAARGMFREAKGRLHRYRYRDARAGRVNAWHVQMVIAWRAYFAGAHWISDEGGGHD